MRGVYRDTLPDLTPGQAVMPNLDDKGNLVVTSAGGGGSVEVSNFPATQPVSGPLTNAQFTAITGAVSSTAWDGAAASATMIAILKAIHAQLKIIATNTTPAG